MVNKLKLLVFLMPLILVACNQPAELITPSPSALPSITPTPSHTPTPTIRPTATRMSALPRPLAEAELIKLLHDNGGCRLPCFWGVVPGETQKDVILSFLNSLDSIRNKGFIIPKDGSIIRIFFNMNSVEDPTNVIDWITIHMSAYRVRESAEGIHHDNVYNNPSLHDYIHYYTLAELLSTYGPPENVWLSVSFGSQAARGGEDLLFVHLDYADSGWAVAFSMPLEVHKEFYLGCPAQAFTTLDLWLPGDTLTEQQRTRWMQDFLFLGVEEAMSLSVDEFYHQFKAPNYDECLETPKDVWPWE